jgi:hypothetical protein
MRHATQHDLDDLEDVLSELRTIPQLRERKRGYFSRGAHAFLHFHEDDGDFYVDVKLTDEFERIRITSRNQQLDFVARVRTAVERKP